MMLFRRQAFYETLNISKVHTEFQGPGCKLAFVAEIQCVGFRKEAGRYRSGTRVDSGLDIFPIRVKQSSSNLVLAKWVSHGGGITAGHADGAGKESENRFPWKSLNLLEVSPHTGREIFYKIPFY